WIVQPFSLGSLAPAVPPPSWSFHLKPLMLPWPRLPRATVDWVPAVTKTFLQRDPSEGSVLDQPDCSSSQILYVPGVSVVNVTSPLLSVRAGEISVPLSYVSLIPVSINSRHPGRPS